MKTNINVQICYNTRQFSTTCTEFIEKYRPYIMYYMRESETISRIILLDGEEWWIMPYETYTTWCKGVFINIMVKFYIVILRYNKGDLSMDTSNLIICRRLNK